MNKKVNKIIAGASSLALVLVFSGPALAQSGETLPANTDKVTTQVAQAETGEQEATTLKQRLEERKAALKLRLSTAQKNRLLSKCQNANGKLNSLEGRIKGIETSRTQVYKNLVDRLTKLSEKLKTKGLDTTELDAHIVTLQEKIETFNTDLANYKQAVADLADMDCKEDVDAFKASLETARELKQKLRESGQDIKEFVKGDIKETLKEIRKQLADSTPDTSDDTPPEEEESEGGEENTGGTDGTENTGGDAGGDNTGTGTNEGEE